MFGRSPALALSRPPQGAEFTTAWHTTSQRRRTVLFAFVMVFGSVALVFAVLWYQFISALALMIFLLVLAVAWRPRVGLLTAFGLVCLFEPGQDYLMMPGYYLINGLSSTLGIRAIIFTPLEMLLILSTIVWLVQGATSHRLDFRKGHLFGPIVFFFMSLVVGYARGMIEGGDWHIAIWESRFLAYIPFCYVLAANVIRTRGHVAAVVGIGFLATTLYAIEGAYRKVALIDTGIMVGMQDFFYSHETVIFLGSVVLLSFAHLVYRASTWQRILAPFAISIAIFTMLASERRAGQMAMMIGFLAFAIVLLIVHRKAFMIGVLPVLIVGSIYLPIFWNASGMLGQPARAIRSLSAPDDRDAASNLSRLLEAINIRATILSNPLLGVGFGRPYLIVVQQFDISFFPFWQYETHNSILWVWMKTGAPGFIIFWVLMGLAIARATFFMKTLPRASDKILVMYAMSAVITTLVFSYVDLALVSARVNMFVGTLLGTLAVVDQVED